MAESEPEQPQVRPHYISLTETTLLEQYKILMDLHKFYFELVLKFTVFHYAVTGGILSFYLSQKNEGFMKYALVFPIIMNLLFALFSFLGAWRNPPLAEEVERVTDLLGYEAHPDLHFLSIVLYLSSGLYFLIALGLTIVSYWRPNA